MKHYDFTKKEEFDPLKNVDRFFVSKHCDAVKTLTLKNTANVKDCTVEFLKDGDIAVMFPLKLLVRGRAIVEFGEDNQLKIFDTVRKLEFRIPFSDVRVYKAIKREIHCQIVGSKMDIIRVNKVILHNN